MTREEIEAKWEGMTPRERDVWISIDVMGYERVRGNDSYVRKDNMASFPKMYSSDISAAWEVFMKFDMPSLKKNFDVDDNDYYLCKIGGIIVFGKTAPEAICKAALLAVLEG